MDQLARSQLVSDLPGAAGRGEIVAFYQPQIDVAEGVVIGAEALARWFHPEVGLVSPDVFIPIAEANGVIDEIGDFMLDAACAFGAERGRRGHEIDVSVNVSAIQLRDDGFAAKVVAALRRQGFDPECLTIEITESVAILDVSEVASRLDWLRAVGVCVSVDDFGTGHSSVDQLLRLHATELKIDQSLVQDDSPASHSLLAAVVSFAHDKGLRVVAEGVETAEQLAAVAKLQCDRAQGFLIGKPMPEHEFDLLLGASPSP